MCRRGGARGPGYVVAGLALLSGIGVSAHPNAGLPDAFGEYTQSAAQMADFIREFAESGWLNIVGGCCGTTPEHIKAIVEVVNDVAPRPIPVSRREGNDPDESQRLFKAELTIAGLEPLKLNEESLFINVGERTNVTGSAKFSRLIR